MTLFPILVAAFLTWTLADTIKRFFTFKWGEALSQIDWLWALPNLQHPIQLLSIDARGFDEEIVRRFLTRCDTFALNFDLLLI